MGNNGTSILAGLQKRVYSSLHTGEIETGYDFIHKATYLVVAEIADASFVGVVYILVRGEVSSFNVKTDLLVGIAERHAFAGKTVDFFYTEHVVVDWIVENVFVDLHSVDDVCCHLEAIFKIVERRKEDFLDNLKIAEIA